MSGLFRLPLAASIIGHGCVAALLILLVGRLPPLPPPFAPRGIEVMLAPPQPPPVAEPAPPEPPPSEVEKPPPELEKPPPVVEVPPPPPRPRPKPMVKPPRRPPPPQPAPAQAPLHTAMVPPPILPAPPQLSAPPPAPTGPVVSAGYRAALSSWLEGHKRYPDSARERGEEGRAVLRFRVDRSGRLLGYAIAQSTGHPDLDAALDQMMRGASLPPFPADMTASEVEVSVAIRFGLAR